MWVQRSLRLRVCALIVSALALTALAHGFECPSSDSETSECQQAQRLLVTAHTLYGVNDPAAYPLYQRVVELEPLLAAAHLNLGCLALASGNTELALRHLQNAARTSQGDSTVQAAAFSNIGVTYRDSNRFDI